MTALSIPFREKPQKATILDRKPSSIVFGTASMGQPLAPSRSLSRRTSTTSRPMIARAPLIYANSPGQVEDSRKTDRADVNRRERLLDQKNL
jgi:hypothetical protein